MPENKRITLTLAILLGIAALFAGIFISQHNHLSKKVDVSGFHGTYLEKPRTVNQFSLTGTDQKQFDNSSLQGQWTFVFFGFTNCGYLCPTTMAELGKMYRILEEKKVGQLPRVVMISVDSERDNLDKLEHYVHTFNPGFYGARGPEDAIQVMTRELGIAYEKVTVKANSNPKNYDVQHSGTIMLFNPHGELNAFFTTPHSADILAEDYLVLTKNSKEL